MEEEELKEKRKKISQNSFVTIRGVVHQTDTMKIAI